MLSTLADDRVTLQYQPLTDCAGRPVGLEALMRWHHRQRGPISPEAFIPIFERSGLILPLSRWALTQACTDAAIWANPLFVSVNLSPIQIQHEDLAVFLQSVLGETGLAPERLELEMTEAALLADPGRSLDLLVKLSALGIQVALDDFGVGRSSPAYLRDFPFAKVKIDRSVIVKLEVSASARSIVHMIIELGHSLDLVVVAEGVETLAQLQCLADEGCDLVQGYLTGRPADISSFSALTGRLPGSAGPSSPGGQFRAPDLSPGFDVGRAET